MEFGRDPDVFIATDIAIITAMSLTFVFIVSAPLCQLLLRSCRTRGDGVEFRTRHDGKHAVGGDRYSVFFGGGATIVGSCPFRSCGTPSVIGIGAGVPFR